MKNENRQMRVLIVDPISDKGHVNYNLGIIRGISHVADYSLIVSQWMQRELQIRGITQEHFLASYNDGWNMEALAAKYRKKLIYHLLFRKYHLQVIMHAKKYGKVFDFVLFTSIDILSFSLASCRFNSRYGVIDHAIGRIAISRIFKTAWKTCNHQVKLVVLEEYIKRFVAENDPGRKVYIIRHPLPREIKSSLASSANEILVYGPSLSNDLSFQEKLKSADIPENILLLLKGKESFSKKGLKIYNDRLSDEQYCAYLEQCHFVLLAYDKNYNYRTSGVLFEAVKAGKPILIYNVNTLSQYKEIFGKNIYLFETVEELLDIILKHSKDRILPYDLSGYSEEGIGKAFSYLCEN